MILVAQIGLSQATDEEILKVAQEQNRVFIMWDRDYRNLIFVTGLWALVLSIFESCPLIQMQFTAN